MSEVHRKATLNAATRRTTSRRRMSRRRVLRGLGGVSLGLPLLEAMLPRGARAQDEAMNVRRVIFEFKPNGDQPSRRFAEKSERDFVFDEFLEPLDDYRDDLVILDRLDKRYGGIPSLERADNHQQGGSALAPWPSGEGDYPVGGEERTVGYVLGPSADHEIGQRVIDVNPSVPYRHLVYRVGGRDNNIWNLHSHAGPPGEKNPVLPETNPYSAYARLFAANGDSEAALEAQRRLELSQSLLDLVLEENGALMPNLGVADRQKIELYTDALRDIERSLTSGATQTGCDPQPLGSEVEVFDDDNHEQVGEAFYKVIAMALACDLTRSVNFNWHGNTSNRVYANLGLVDGHHDISHRSDDEAFTQIRAIHRHLWALSTSLYDELSQIPEGDGTLWDNVMIVNWNELGQGDVHSTNDCLVVLAGGMSGYFDRGRYLDFSNTVSFSDMLVSCFHFMGFEDVETFGDERLASGGPIADLTV